MAPARAFRRTGPGAAETGFLRYSGRGFRGRRRRRGCQKARARGGAARADQGRSSPGARALRHSTPVRAESQGHSPGFGQLAAVEQDFRRAIAWRVKRRNHDARPRAILMEGEAVEHQRNGRAIPRHADAAELVAAAGGVRFAAPRANRRRRAAIVRRRRRRDACRERRGARRLGAAPHIPRSARPPDRIVWPLAAPSRPRPSRGRAVSFISHVRHNTAESTASDRKTIDQGAKAGKASVDPGADPIHLAIGHDQADAGAEIGPHPAIERRRARAAIRPAPPAPRTARSSPGSADCRPAHRGSARGNHRP